MLWLALNTNTNTKTPSEILFEARKRIAAIHRDKNKRMQSQLGSRQEATLKDFRVWNDSHPSGKETNEQWNDHLWATDGKQGREKETSDRVHHPRNQSQVTQEWGLCFASSFIAWTFSETHWWYPYHPHEVSSIKTNALPNDATLSKERAAEEVFPVVSHCWFHQPARLPLLPVFCTHLTLPALSVMLLPTSSP